MDRRDIERAIAEFSVIGGEFRRRGGGAGIDQRLVWVETKRGNDFSTFHSAADGMGGVSLLVTDSAGVSRAAPLYFVSSGQVNFEVPPGRCRDLRR